MARAYGGPVVGGGTEASKTTGRIPPSRPNWWVILAVSLALIAVLVATGGAPRDGARHGRRLPDAAAGDASTTLPDGPGASDHASNHASNGTTRVLAPTTSPAVATPARSTTDTTTTTVPLLSTRTAPPTTGAPAPAQTTTTVGPTTTTTAPVPDNAQPSDRTQQTGVMVPPGSMSHDYAFTGTGAMQVSVVWSGDTYLTMVVSCPSGGQSVGGTSAMAADLPDATGSCLATVTEPASEDVTLSYTITIGPAGG
jgi:cytoskeletal protein RodZ